MNLQDYAAQDEDALRAQVAPATPLSAPAPAPSPAAAALANPDFAAFVAKRAKDLLDAQTQARGDQRWADAANAGAKVSAALEGKDVDKAVLDANNARAQRPVAQALQQQAAGDQATKDYAAQQDIGAKGAAAAYEAAKRDPNSAPS